MNYDINEHTKKMVDWIENDNFKNPDTIRNPRNQLFLHKLQLLKQEFLDFYFGDADQSSRVFDIHTKAKKYLIQISRLRMVIEPEIQIAANTHTATKIEYITTKGFWLDDEGNKFRKFTKSLGRVSQYPEGRKSMEAYREGEKQMQKIMWDEYKKEYPSNNN